MSEAKVEFEKRFGGMTPDHPCVPDVWMNGFEAGKSSRDGLRKALEKIAGEDRCDNRTVSASMAIAMMALEADGEVK